MVPYTVYAVSLPIAHSLKLLIHIRKGMVFKFCWELNIKSFYSAVLPTVNFQTLIISLLVHFLASSNPATGVKTRTFLLWQALKMLGKGMPTD